MDRFAEIEKRVMEFHPVAAGDPANVNLRSADTAPAGNVRLRHGPGTSHTCVWACRRRVAGPVLGGVLSRRHHRQRSLWCWLGHRRRPADAGRGCNWMHVGRDQPCAGLVDQRIDVGVRRLQGGAIAECRNPGLRCSGGGRVGIDADRAQVSWMSSMRVAPWAASPFLVCTSWR